MLNLVHLASGIWKSGFGRWAQSARKEGEGQVWTMIVGAVGKSHANLIANPVLPLHLHTYLFSILVQEASFYSKPGLFSFMMEIHEAPKPETLKGNTSEMWKVCTGQHRGLSASKAKNAAAVPSIPASSSCFSTSWHR